MCRRCDGDGFILVGYMRYKRRHDYLQKRKKRKAEFSVRTAPCPVCQEKGRA